MLVVLSLSNHFSDRCNSVLGFSIVTVTCEQFTDLDIDIY